MEEESRFDRVKRFAEIHYLTRYQANKSQEYMAMELGVSKKTVQNWEKGISSPTFFQSMEWFRICNANPFPPLMAFFYPHTIKKLKASDSDKEIDEAFASLCETLPTNAKRSILYIFAGEHGSSPNALMQLILAYLHTPLTSRIMQAALIKHTFEMEKGLNNLICTDNIMPNMEVLDKAMFHARVAALGHEYGYALLDKDNKKEG